MFFNFFFRDSDLCCLASDLCNDSSVILFVLHPASSVKVGNDLEFIDNITSFLRSVVWYLRFNTMVSQATLFLISISVL